MIIPLTVDISPSNSLLIELQGKLETNAEEWAGLTLGDLDLSTPDKPVLIIGGKQRLVGKRVPLKKPMALVEVTEDDHMLLSRMVEEKIIFDIRPTIIFNNN